MADILEALKELRSKSKPRNFVQTVDLIVNLKEIDLKKPENKINEVVELPYGRGKEASVVVFSDEIKNLDVPVLNSKDIEELAKNKRACKKLAKETEFFLSEAKLMPVVGKHLGRYLAPRNKMPKLISGDVKQMIESMKKSVRVKIKSSPVIQCPVGTEKMKDEEIAENIKQVLKFLEEKLPKGKNNIKNVFVKLTMSAPVKVEVSK